MFPPGLRIGLTPPGDLKPSTHFPGFEDIDRKVAVTIFDLPGNAYAEMERAANPDSQPGLTEVKQEAFKFNSGTGTLISAQVDHDGAKLRQWILLARASAARISPMLIKVDVPDAARAVYSDAAIRQALASVTFRPAPIQEQLGLLPFKLGEMAGFRVAKVLSGGSVILTEGPGDDLGKQPYIVVSIGRGSPEQPADRQRFARDLLLSAPLHELTYAVGRGHAHRRPARLRNPGAGQGAQRRAADGGAMAALQRQRLSARHRRRAQGRLGRDVYPLPRGARRRRTALNERQSARI